MKVCDALIAAKKLISKRKHWCTGSFARDAQGEGTDIEDGNTVRWCAMGALRKVTQTPILQSKMPVGFNALHKFSRKLGFVGITNLNDNSSHKKVMEMFECAIQDACKND